MPFSITPITNHREREKGCIVYPVYSRRSEGLSVGINLFTEKKICLFDCPYCEVFPFLPNAGFSIEQMHDDLYSVIESAKKQNIIVKDICFSGNGEPTLSPLFPEALKMAETIRAQMVPSANLVVITSGTGLLQPKIFSLLKEYAVNLFEISEKNPDPSKFSDNGRQIENKFDIWLKLDSGTPDWYQKMNRSSIEYEKLIEMIKEFVLKAPVTIQTMICAINGEQPSSEETKAWESLVCELAETANKADNFIRKVQIYGKARAAPEDPLASALPAEYLEERTEALRRKFTEKKLKVPVDLYL